MERVSLSQQELNLDQIEARDALCDSMLDLQAGVNLKEVELE